MKHVLGFLIVMHLFMGTGEAREDHPFQDYVVTLSVTSQTYNPYRPWEKEKPGKRSAQAMVVTDSLLLTTAQAVADATMVQVKKHGRSAKTQAVIYHMDREINLALLSVPTSGFFDDLKPAPISREMPTQGDANSVRWKKRQLEIAQTRLGRIEVVASRTGSVRHAVLKGTTDLPDENAADPVFLDDEVIGLTVSQSRQVVEILPAHTLRAYIDMATSGNYQGFATLTGFSFQYQNDPGMSAWLGQDGAPHGILIRKIRYNETGYNVLEPMDLLLSIDGHTIDSYGYYTHANYGQLDFRNIVTEGHGVGDRVWVKVLRNGQIRRLEMVLKGFPLKQRLIPYRRTDYAPPYFVAGGLVFRELDFNYLQARGKNWRSKSDARLVLYWDLERFDQTPERKRIIILSHVLPDAYNIGYHDIGDLAVKRVNNFRIGSMAELEDAFLHPQGPFHVIEFERNYSRNKVVLDAKTYDSATQKILSNYNIYSGSSSHNERLQ
jgi:PDZ domain